MRILSITPSFFPSVGGLEQVVMELAKRVRASGLVMDVAHVAKGLDDSVDEVQGIPVHRIRLIGNRFFGLSPSLGRLARGYDLLHVHDPQLLALSGNVRWLCGAVPAVLSTHGGFWHTKQHYWLKRTYEATLLKGYAGHYRRVLASSVGDFDYFRGFAREVALCSNGVSVKRFNAVSATPARSVFRWIYWGRLYRNKRLDLAVEYVGHARRAGLPVELLICGRDLDDLLPSLRAQVARLGLEGSVTFEPYLDDAALVSELGGRGVFVSASQYEGFGLGIVEAMAGGLIVLCRDMAPINGFFEHGKSGFFLSFDGSVADVDALCSHLRMGAADGASISAAARAAASVHDWDAVVPRFLRHYREVLAETAVEP